MRKLSIYFISLTLLVLVAAGCSKAPTVEQEAATSAMAAATAAEAETYAAESMQKARSAQQAFEEEMKLQEGKFALLRKYDAATALAQEAKAAAEMAAQQAVENKNQMRQELAGMIQETRTLLTEAQGMLSTAPTGKGSTMDLQVMKSDLTAAGTTVDEAQALLDQDKLADGMAKVQAARTTILSVKTSVEQAIQMKAGARKSG